MALHFGASRDDEVSAGDKFGSLMCDVDFRQWLLCLVWSQGRPGKSISRDNSAIFVEWLVPDSDNSEPM